MKTKILLVFLSLLLIIPNFINIDINGTPTYNKIERFNPAITNIHSVELLEKLVDDSAAIKNIDLNSEKYTALLAYVISCRFFHGFSHYQLNENWIAAFGEKWFGYGLASKVDPEDIMQTPHAACSQQAIIMMTILRRKNISFRKVCFPHHFALETKINKNWYYFDPDMEPAITLDQRLHENWNGNNDTLKKYYSDKHGDVNWQFGINAKATFGAVNEEPAKNAKIFHSVTAVLSKIAWCFPLLIALALKRRPRMHVVKPVNHYFFAKKLNAFFFPRKLYF